MTGCGATPVSTRYFCDDFESGLSNWLVATLGWNTVNTTYQSPTHAVTDSPDGDYLQGAANEITMVSSVDLTGAVSPVLVFWHTLDLNSFCYSGGRNYCGVCGSDCSDQAFVEASSDSGTTWSQLSQMYCGNNTTTWSFQQLSLSAYVGTKIKIRFRLWDDTSGSCQADGWYLDDIEIREAN